VFALVLLSSAPAFAQFHGIDVHPFVLVTDQRFAAQTSFKAEFDSAAEAFWGAGVDIVYRRAYFLDLSVSHMSKTGQRAFLNNGDVFRLGVPVRAVVTPLELTAGYRVRLRRSRIVPYAGAGVGTYAYRETSDFSAAGEDVAVSHAGFLAVGGAEVRVSRWIAVTGDVQYTKVPGILGQGGISKDVDESNLGGVAARLRVILGR